jgi:hypothetical protein
MQQQQQQQETSLLVDVIALHKRNATPPKPAGELHTTPLTVSVRDSPLNVMFRLSMLILYLN